MLLLNGNRYKKKPKQRSTHRSFCVISIPFAYLDQLRFRVCTFFCCVCMKFTGIVPEDFDVQSVTKMILLKHFSVSSLRAFDDMYEFGKSEILRCCSFSFVLTSKPQNTTAEKFTWIKTLQIDMKRKLTMKTCVFCWCFPYTLTHTHIYKFVHTIS